MTSGEMDRLAVLLEEMDLHGADLMNTMAPETAVKMLAVCGFIEEILRRYVLDVCY